MTHSRRAGLLMMRTAVRVGFLGILVLAGHEPGIAQPEENASANGPVASQDWLPVQSFQLGNGVRLHVVRRPLSAWVSAGWAVRAGAADDPVGGSGTAHLVEHLLYTGTPSVGTRDWRAEQPLLEEEARLVEELLDRDSAADRSRLAQVRSRLGRLQQPGDLARRWAAAGIRSEGALTTKDFSLYRASFPLSGLGTWFELELERLARPAFRLLAREQDVVVEENLQRVASVPQAPVEERFDRFFWGQSPYGRPPDDAGELVRVLRRQLQAFHRLHYRPENIVVAVVGDVEPLEVLEVARSTFGTLAATTDVVAPENSSIESAGAAPNQPRWSAAPAGRREVARCDCRPSARIRFPAVPYEDPDAVAFDVLAAVLNGRSGRLMQGLVGSRSEVFAAYASHKAQARAGTFSVVTEAVQNTVDQGLLEGFIAALRAQLQSLVAEETALRPAELERARNMLLASAAREVKASDALRSRLLIDDALGDGERLRRWSQRVEAVTLDQLTALVRRFLVPGRGESVPGVEFLVLHESGAVSGGGSP